MSGKILTPGDVDVKPDEWSLVVNVNGSPQPVGLAKLMVANEIANNLARIADVLEHQAKADYGFEPRSAPERAGVEEDA